MKKEIEDYVYPKSIYGGEWIMKNFNVRPGPVISKIKLMWKQKYGDKIDSVPEEELKKVTQDFLDKQ